MATIKVQKGETLWGIAQRELGAGHRWKELGGITPDVLADPRRLQIGAVLTIPDRPTPAPVTPPTPEITPPVAPVAPVAPPTPPVEPIRPITPQDIMTPDLPEPTAPATTEAYFTSLTANLEAQRIAVEEAHQRQLDDINRQREETQKRIDEITAQQEGVMEKVEPLTAPFREEFEKTERERLKVEENFFANQALVNELNILLTEGNELIRQQRDVTGLRVIRDPRIAKTISDVSARVGVIEAVMSARTGQIGEAYRLIDRSVRAMTADRQDQLNYFNTLLSFYDKERDIEGRKLITLTKDQKSFMNAQIGMLEDDLKRTQDNAERIKELMTSPESALFMAQAGITLNDTEEEIARKIAAQSQIVEVNDFKNNLIKQGMEFVPFPQVGQDVQTFNVGGQSLAFKRPPEDVKRLSVSEAKKLGVPFGTTEEQAFDLMPQIKDRQEGFAYAEELIELNPTATDQELRAELQRQPEGTRLNESEINTLLKGRISDDDVRFEAEELIIDMWDKDIFKREFPFIKTKKDEFAEAVEKAKEDIRQGGIIVIEIIDGKKKTVNLDDTATQERFIKMIDTIDFETVKELLKERE